MIYVAHMIRPCIKGFVILLKSRVYYKQSMDCPLLSQFAILSQNSVGHFVPHVRANEADKDTETS